jgi:hypothetical protein
VAEPVHGTISGVDYHLRVPESLCLPCADHHADYRRAGRIRHGNVRTVRVSTAGLMRILAGESAVDVLDAEFGPLTLDVLRGGRGGRRG